MTLVSSVLVNAAPVISLPDIVAHAGAADTAPVPVWDRYCLAVVMFPANLANVLAAELYKVSPRV